MSFLKLNSAPVVQKQEGWLMKKGKKRYFVLSSAQAYTLTWFEKPLAKTKGSLDIREYNLEDVTQTSFTLVSPTLKKSFKLSTLNAETTVEPFVVWISKHTGKTIREDKLLKNNQGFLTKKGKEKIFCLVPNRISIDLVRR